jgi:hypothetical protein
MLHACSYTICLVFCYTSWHFYAFYGTNILTRCHSASSLFSAIFVFQKSYTRNILRIGRNKSRTSYFYQSFAKTEDDTERGQGPASPPGARPSPWPHPPMVRAPWSTPDDAPSPIKSPRWEKPKPQSIFQKHITIHRHRRPKIGRVQKLFPAPCRRGESPPEVFFIAMLASGAMSE